MSTIFGYTFKNAALLEEALITPTCRASHPNIQDNQRLEFLGDAVLALLGARCVFEQFPQEQEGPLSARRAHMVSAEALCKAVEGENLQERLKFNKGQTPPPQNSKTYADAVEAILGAAYLDGGLAAAERMFETLKLAEFAEEDLWEGNPKGELQVRAQAMTPVRHPVYTVLKTTGASHNPTFSVKVSVEGLGEAIAEAHSLRKAETLAAAKLLSSMNRR